TDTLSARIGKQQVIWSETDALSGTGVTNPVNATGHGVYRAEERQSKRTHFRMIKLNSLRADFFKTANNEIEGFIIPGDFQGAGIQAQTDPRNPWVAPAALFGGCPISRCGFGGLDTPFPFNINQNGQAVNVSELPNTLGLNSAAAMIALLFGSYKGKPAYQYYDVILKGIS